MTEQLLHVFRNTPFGRETLLQSVYFCRELDLELLVYVPLMPQFLMYFEQGIVTVDLDRAFLRAPQSARQHVEELLAPLELPYRFFEPKRFTAGELPELPVDVGFMSCPRSISDLSTKIGLGTIGPRVRAIVQKASFPVLLPAAAYKEWHSIVCFFGGSANARLALVRARQMSSRSGVPLQIFTQAEMKRERYAELLGDLGLREAVESGEVEWLFFEAGDFRENLYEVPYDALVVMGAYGHGIARELFFGSRMEEVQSVLPNPLLLVGPHCSLVGSAGPKD